MMIWVIFQCHLAGLYFSARTEYRGAARSETTAGFILGTLKLWRQARREWQLGVRIRNGLEQGARIGVGGMAEYGPGWP